jgi:hypothetical protein
MLNYHLVQDTEHKGVPLKAWDLVSPLDYSTHVYWDRVTFARENTTE